MSELVFLEGSESSEVLFDRLQQVVTKDFLETLVVRDTSVPGQDSLRRLSDLGYRVEDALPVLLDNPSFHQVVGELPVFVNLYRHVRNLQRRQQAHDAWRKLMDSPVPSEPFFEQGMQVLKAFYQLFHPREQVLWDARHRFPWSKVPANKYQLMLGGYDAFEVIGHSGDELTRPQRLVFNLLYQLQYRQPDHMLLFWWLFSAIKLFSAFTENQSVPEPEGWTVGDHYEITYIASTFGSEKVYAYYDAEAKAFLHAQHQLIGTKSWWDRCAPALFVEPWRDMVYSK